ncbi:type II secretion system F family protein [Alkalicaulis satelles]|uniref:Type II secretion system F family protein n=1 Tax=Alkalicaulis satelles TaxID=2609175 RepID=A0A5M6ZIZ4_9PROT|nr:type II secretion system F family protein [Alkalicaulis satelles]KAA5802191.1 type II secretion system F family protein [Alkalicaulis satelles]
MGGDAAFILAAVCAFVAVAAAGFALVPGDTGKARKSRMAVAVGEPVRRGARKVAALDSAAQKRKQIQETLKDLEDRQKAERKKSLTLKARLEQAGLKATPVQFWLASAALGAGGALAIMAAGLHILMALAVGFVAGLGLPRWVLGMMRKRRQAQFTSHFADALDIITRGIKSGLPLNECLKVIAREAESPVRQEFQLLVEGVQVGVELDEGLRRMMARMPLPELSFFMIVLVIQQKTGGNLSEALGNLSAVLRARKMMREKVAALSSEAKASAFIIGSLPPAVAGMVSVMSPSYMAPLFTTPIGQLLLMGGVMWMGIGIMVMRGMINFKM